MHPGGGGARGDGDVFVSKSAEDDVAAGGALAVCQCDLRVVFFF